MDTIEEIPKVIQNSDYLYKSDVKWASDIEYIEPNDYERDMLKDTKTVEMLLEEEQQEQLLMSEEDKLKEKKRNLLIMFKVIASHRMGLHPLVNVSTLQPEQYKKIIEIIESLVKDYMNNQEEDIANEFNKICNDQLFSPGSDVSMYPVYKNV